MMFSYLFGLFRAALGPYDQPDLRVVVAQQGSCGINTSYRCPVYDGPEDDNCPGISWRMHPFCAIKLP